MRLFQPTSPFPRPFSTKRQKELGVVIIDVGAGSTSVAIFEGNNLALGMSAGWRRECHKRHRYRSSHIHRYSRENQIEYGSVLPAEIQEHGNDRPRHHKQKWIRRRSAVATWRKSCRLVTTNCSRSSRRTRASVAMVCFLPARSSLGAAVKAPGVLDIARSTRLAGSNGFPS